MTALSFFRKEVLEEASYRNLGGILLNTPVPNLRFTLFWSVLILILLSVFLNQDYTEQWTLKGFINAKGGVTHVYASKPGVIQVSYVQQGKQVQRGDTLLIVSTNGDEGTRAQSVKIQQSFEKRLHTMRQALLYKEHFLAQLKPLLKKQYIAKLFFDQKREDIVSLKNQIEVLESEQARFYQSQTSSLKAPITGVISSVMVHIGQHVTVDKPLLTLLPRHPDYVAQLYVPVEKAGFLKEKDALSLHYEAYPYRHFGSGTAEVTSISETVLTDKEEDKLLEIHQPYYKALAKLTASPIGQDKKAYRVYQGMMFEAIATGGRRKIWQWLLAPGDGLWPRART